MSATITQPEIRIFAPLGKAAAQPDGTLLVPFVASTESLDDQGEIVDFEAVKKAAVDYMAWANVREMHQPSAVGVTVELTVDDALRKVSGVAHVVDPVAAAKVSAGVYKGVSLGGRKLAAAMAKVGGRSVRKITEILWNELSLVDRPSNPDAVLTLAKRSVAGEEPIDEDLEKAGWLPEGTSQGDLDDGDFAWLSDAYKAGNESKTEGRKLPYKVHGKVNEAGWKAAWSRAHQAGTDFSGGPSKQEVIAKLMKDKPADVEVNDAEKAAQPGDLAKASAPAAQPEGTPAGDAPAAEAAPTAGVDTYVGPDGQPLAKQAAPAEDPPAEPLAKSAQDDVMSADIIVEGIARLIDTEAGEGDSDGVASLKQALAAMQAFLGKETAELGTPEDAQQQEAEEAAEAPMVVMPMMAYATVRGDLQKIAGRLQKGSAPSGEEAKRIQELHDLTTAAGAMSTAIVSSTEPLAKVSEISDEVLAKITSHFAEAIGPIASARDIDAVKAELLGAIEPIKQDLQKIAATPMPGGPLRYAADDRRGIVFDGSQDKPIGSSSIAEALQKASQAVTDPYVRETLGRLAAAEEIAAARAAGSRG